MADGPVSFLLPDQIKALDAETLASAKTYTDSAIGGLPPAEVDKEYVDTQDITVKAEANAYTDTKTANMVTLNTNQQIDGYKIFASGHLQVTGNPTSATDVVNRSYIDGKDADTLSAANKYTDEHSGGGVTKEYVDTQDATKEDKYYKPFYNTEATPLTDIPLETNMRNAHIYLPATLDVTLPTGADVFIYDLLRFNTASEEDVENRLMLTYSYNIFRISLRTPDGDKYIYSGTTTANTEFIFPDVDLIVKYKEPLPKDNLLGRWYDQLAFEMAETKEITLQYLEEQKAEKPRETIYNLYSIKDLPIGANLRNYTVILPNPLDPGAISDYDWSSVSVIQMNDSEVIISVRRSGTTDWNIAFVDSTLPSGEQVIQWYKDSNLVPTMTTFTFPDRDLIITGKSFPDSLGMTGGWSKQIVIGALEQAEVSIQDVVEEAPSDRGLYVRNGNTGKWVQVTAPPSWAEHGNDVTDLYYSDDYMPLIISEDGYMMASRAIFDDPSYSMRSGFFFKTIVDTRWRRTGGNMKYNVQSGDGVENAIALTPDGKQGICSSCYLDDPTGLYVNEISGIRNLGPSGYSSTAYTMQEGISPNLVGSIQGSLASVDISANQTRVAAMPGDDGYLSIAVNHDSGAAAAQYTEQRLYCHTDLVDFPIKFRPTKVSADGKIIISAYKARNNALCGYQKSIDGGLTYSRREYLTRGDLKGGFCKISKDMSTLVGYVIDTDNFVTILVERNGVYRMFPTGKRVNGDICVDVCWDGSVAVVTFVDRDYDTTTTHTKAYVYKIENGVNMIDLKHPGPVYDSEHRMPICINSTGKSIFTVTADFVVTEGVGGHHIVTIIEHLNGAWKNLNTLQILGQPGISFQNMYLACDAAGENVMCLSAETATLDRLTCFGGKYNY